MPAVSPQPGREIRGRNEHLPREDCCEPMPLDPVAQHPGFLSSGELGRLIVGFDWSKTSLGPIDAWPQVVKTTVALIFRSPGADRHLVGRRRGDDLQRRLFGVRRRPPSRAARLQGPRRLARSRRFQRQYDEIGVRARRDLVLPGPGVDLVPPRPSRAGVDEPRLFAGCRRGRLAGRGHRHRRRDDRQGTRRAQGERGASAARADVRRCSRFHGVS
jgi:hypothetical protein